MEQVSIDHVSGVIDTLDSKGFPDCPSRRLERTSWISSPLVNPKPQC